MGKCNSKSSPAKVAQCLHGVPDIANLMYDFPKAKQPSIPKCDADFNPDNFPCYHEIRNVFAIEEYQKFPRDGMEDHDLDFVVLSEGVVRWFDATKYLDELKEAPAFGQRLGHTSMFDEKQQETLQPHCKYDMKIGKRLPSYPGGEKLSKEDLELAISDKEIKPKPCEEKTHVKWAGVLKVNKFGELKSFDNNSGHFCPPHSTGLQLAKRFKPKYTGMDLGLLNWMKYLQQESPGFFGSDDVEKIFRSFAASKTSKKFAQYDEYGDYYDEYAIDYGSGIGLQRAGAPFYYPNQPVVIASDAPQIHLSMLAPVVGIFVMAVLCLVIAFCMFVVGATAGYFAGRNTQNKPDSENDFGSCV